ncbi:SDR family oxidoreductase [Nostoc favosum]|uniref:SDR family oxidoreductase n=1 Tax=Nostoc favosum CHAB5714 TaxID=2780399 RepID=A0ABS8IIC4_9NOSO|nr:SDR family oxidoreductase [Nostoc favosum]MCC5603262.1 SDR family oxidoreductase [Nostoc favosum CHAB5714]
MKFKPWCLVLGASSGIGKACTLSLSARGMNIIGVHLDTAERQPEIDELIAQLKHNQVDVRFFNANAASDSARSEIISEIVNDLKEVNGIRVLVHSLAFGTLLPFIRQKPNEDIISRRHIEMTLSVMSHSLVYWVQDLFDGGLLQPGAKIFALTSAGSTKVTRNYGAVSAAKCALESHVRQLALELAPYQIAVNAIRAGVTVTPSLQRIPEHEEIIERAKRYNPHQRLTLPEDIGDAIALLISSNSSWLTGNVIGVDGGEFYTV